MAGDRYQKIVDLLIARTSGHDLDWKETADSDVFQVSLSNYSIILSEEPRYTASGMFNHVLRSVRKFSVRNPDGTEIDSFTDDDLPQDYSPRTSELFRNARRQALGVDRALDEILSELEVR